MSWPDYVGFGAVVLVVVSVIALMIHDARASSRRQKPPETLGKK